jgi:pimeloyl-ACP methyl ester carboxylesterase
VQRFLSLLLAVALGTLSGCSFGLRYDADTSGLSAGSITDPETGRALAYLEAGDPDAPRLIFIHGAPGRASVWIDDLRHPIGGFDAIAVDRLGYGNSRRAGTVRSFKEQAAAIAPLLVARHGRYPIIVAHSLGCPIACRLAADNPGKVGGLILIGAPLDPSLERLRWYNRAAGTLAVSIALDEKLIVANRELWAAKAEETALEPLLASITCPITIIHGTRDSLVPYANVPYMQRHFTGASRLRIITLDHEDHFIPRLRPDVVRGAIEDLSRASKATGS